MNNLMPYLPTTLILIGLIAINVKLSSKPSFDKARELFQEKNVCDERSGRIEAKLNEISQDVKELIKNGR